MVHADYDFELPPFKKMHQRAGSTVERKNAKKSVKPIRIRERVAIIVDEDGSVISEIPLRDIPMKRVMSSAKGYSQSMEKTVWVYIAKKKYEIPYELDLREEWYDE
jgi:hypothetical protein